MCLSFSNLQKGFTWDPIYKDRIMKNFENKGNGHLRNFLSKARKHSKKSQWLGDDQWKGLQEYSVNESYKKLCEKAQKNQIGNPQNLRPYLHTYGSIHIHEHRRRLVPNRTSYNVVSLLCFFMVFNIFF